MPADTRFAAASTQHPNIAQGLAEVVGEITERQVLAPSAVLVGVTGRYINEAGLAVAALHSLLQSELTLAIPAIGMSGGGRILDPTGSLAVLSLAEVDVSVGLDLNDRPPAFALRQANQAVVTFNSDGIDQILLFDGQQQTAVNRIQLTLDSVSPVLTSSIGATPVGLTLPVTNADGRRIRELDGLPARQLVIGRLEMMDHDEDGPSSDLPRMMAELVDLSGPDRFVAITSSNPEDQSLTLDRPVPEMTRIQLFRHDPATAVSDVIAGQHQGRSGPPEALLLLTELGTAANNVVETAGDVLTAVSLGFLRRRAPYSALSWPSTSLLSLA